MPAKTTNVALVILAAGASRRMGTPKQLLPWGEDYLLGHVVKNALKTVATEIIVVLGANYDYINQKVDRFPVTVLNNTDWSMGLGMSIAMASNYIKEQVLKPDGILITLADQPFVTPDYLNNMISVFLPGRNQIISTSYQHQSHGVPVLFDLSYLDQLRQLNSDVGAKSIVDKNQHFITYLRPEFNNADLDTIEDYKTYRKQGYDTDNL
ncbi:nucleotidyltransferase family protein [Aestuariivivens sediminis]|uniref:nucleotidyltransferase family protein n=1 Tax=Aestuariivivens sediminis TaxID=2913557 RepID=UPI001F57C1FB